MQESRGGVRRPRGKMVEEGRYWSSLHSIAGQKSRPYIGLRTKAMGQLIWEKVGGRNEGRKGCQTHLRIVSLIVLVVEMARKTLA